MCINTTSCFRNKFITWCQYRWDTYPAANASWKFSRCEYVYLDFMWNCLKTQEIWHVQFRFAKGKPTSSKPFFFLQTNQKLWHNPIAKCRPSTLFVSPLTPSDEFLAIIVSRRSCLKKSKRWGICLPNKQPTPGRLPTETHGSPPMVITHIFSYVPLGEGWSLRYRHMKERLACWIPLSLLLHESCLSATSVTSHSK